MTLEFDTWTKPMSDLPAIHQGIRKQRHIAHPAKAELRMHMYSPTILIRHDHPPLNLATGGSTIASLVYTLEKMELDT